MYFHRGWYNWRDPQSGRWHPLGKEWDREARAKSVELSTGKAPAGTLAELLDAFLEHCEDLVRQGTRSRHTFDVNRYEAEKLKNSFGRMDYRALTSKHCASYLDRRTDKRGNPTPVRANREIALLSSAYSWAMRKDRYNIKSNPCYGVRRNKERSRERYVETSELRNFTQH